MKKVLIAYFSLTGKTEKMAEYIAEGVRFSGQQAVTKKISDIKTANDLNGYDGYIFGSPTYHRDMAEPMKTFLFLAKNAGLRGKTSGSLRFLHSQR
jgi:flavodoxin